jgi:hypothetical protein
LEGAQPESHEFRHVQREGGRFVNHLDEEFARQFAQQRVVGSLCPVHLRLAVREREFAKKIARREHRQNDFTALRGPSDNLDRPGLDDVNVLAGVTG